jgi:spore coat polysaccharide biosynthesis protein SpsF
MNPLVIIQARSTSTRLPDKVLLPLKGKPVIEYCIESVSKSGIPFVVAIPTGDRLEEYLTKRQLPFFEGFENDVLGRYYLCAFRYHADYICRITSDCVFILPETIMYLCSIAMGGNLDFVSNTFKPFTTFEGNDCEVMSYRCLKWLKKNALEDKYKEHVTNYLYEHKEDFDKTGMTRHAHNWNINLSYMKTSIDTKEDLGNAERLML